MNKPYWETETPEVFQLDKQVYSYYKKAKVLEISTMKEEDDGTIKPIRRQAILGRKIFHHPAVCNMLVNFLEDSGLVETISGDEGQLLD